MEFNRIIKDSDDEDEDDPLAGDPPEKQPAQGTNTNGTSNAREINQVQSQNNHFSISQPAVDFDQFIQSPSAAQSQPSLSQQQREEKWIPSGDAGPGVRAGGSIGAVMTEIGHAQRRLVDDEVSLVPLPTAPCVEPMPSDLEYEGGELQVGDGQGIVGREGLNGFETGAGYEGKQENGLGQVGHMSPVTNDPELQPEMGLPPLHAVENANSLSNYDYEQSNASYNIFESVNQSTDTHTGSSAKQDCERTYKSPHRSKTMQPTPHSPHDTEPFSSMVSPKLSRAKNDNAGSSTSSNDRPAPVVEVPPKNRGRKRKQTLEEHNENSNPGDCGSSEQDTKTEKRKPGRPPSNAKARERSDDNTAKNHLDPPSTIGVEAKELSDPNGAAVPNGTHDPRTEIEETQGISVEPSKNAATPPHSPAKETIFAVPTKPARKEPKKKKLKRGKTTSVALQKTRGFDVEDDVIWVDDKPINSEFHNQSTLSSETKQESMGTNIEAQTPERDNSTSQAEIPGHKKPGRKRKKTSEQMGPEEPNSVQDKPPTEADPSTTPDNTTIITTTNEESHTKTNPDPEEERKQPSRPTTPQKPTPDANPEAEADPKADTDTDKDNDKTKQATKHSPIAGTSKVPYRVGLSRRARIAPLLRVVRR